MPVLIPLGGGFKGTCAKAVGNLARIQMRQVAMRQKLQDVFEQKSWANKSGGPRSGHGSTLKATARLRSALPEVFSKYGVKSFVDAPCGDWTWMQTVDLTGIAYLGADISPTIVRENIAAHSKRNIRFEVLDITSSPLPPSDLFLCRECLFHLKYWLRWDFFANFAKSDGRFLMTTIDHVTRNKNVSRNAAFERFDPRLPPFNLPEPLEIVPENYAGDPKGALEQSDQPWKLRSSGIWSIDQIRTALQQRDESA